MSARVPATDTPPPRVMVVTCPDLRRTDLRPDPDIQTARRHEQVVAAVTGFCPDVDTRAYPISAPVRFAGSGASGSSSAPVRSAGVSVTS